MKSREVFYIQTFGCQMNVADSERISRVYQERGYQETNNIKKAGVVIINTCVVRQSAENRAYGLIRNVLKQHKDKQIILTGCLAGWALRDKSGKNLRLLRKRIGPRVQVVLIEELAGFDVQPLRSGKSHAWIPISTGCNNFCAFCIVPYTRGRELSRPFEKIVGETRELIKKGYQQLTLLGQNVNSYGADIVSLKFNSVAVAESKKVTFVKHLGKQRIPTLFPHLLKTVAEIPGVKLVDFISSNPWDFSDELIEVIASHSNVTRTIHLPVQSGDDQILQKMNRWYTSREYLRLVEKIKKAIPEVEFTTDIIVGFPGETEEQFKNTVRLCQKVGFKRAYIARYSPRPGTPAAKLEDDVDPKEKKRRWWLIKISLLDNC
jgi:tRNA-2-methylthio-N6-dimethylallyladenosine synthase